MESQSNQPNLAQILETADVVSAYEYDYRNDYSRATVVVRTGKPSLQASIAGVVSEALNRRKRYEALSPIRLE